MNRKSANIDPGCRTLRLDSSRPKCSRRFPRLVPLSALRKFGIFKMVKKPWLHLPKLIHKILLKTMASQEYWTIVHCACQPAVKSKSRVELFLLSCTEVPRWHWKPKTPSVQSIHKHIYTRKRTMPRAWHIAGSFHLAIATSECKSSSKHKCFDEQLDVAPPQIPLPLFKTLVIYSIFAHVQQAVSCWLGLPFHTELTDGK